MYCNFRLLHMQGVTDEVHYHQMKFIPGNMSYEAVLEMAGPTIANFCKDYTTIYAIATPLTNAKRGQSHFHWVQSKRHRLRFSTRTCSCYLTKTYINSVILIIELNLTSLRNIYIKMCVVLNEDYS